jgi:hypothetical protein
MQSLRPPLVYLLLRPDKVLRNRHNIPIHPERTKPVIRKIRNPVVKIGNVFQNDIASRHRLMQNGYDPVLDKPHFAVCTYRSRDLNVVSAYGFYVTGNAVYKYPE